MKLFYGRIKALTYFASGQLGFESKLPESFPIKPPAQQTPLVAETRNSSKVTRDSASESESESCPHPPVTAGATSSVVVLFIETQQFGLCALTDKSAAL